MSFVIFSGKNLPFDKIAVRPENVHIVKEISGDVFIGIEEYDTYNTVAVAETFSEVMEMLNGGDVDDQ